MAKWLGVSDWSPSGLTPPLRPQELKMCSRILIVVLLLLCPALSDAYWPGEPRRAQIEWPPFGAFLLRVADIGVGPSLIFLPPAVAQLNPPGSSLVTVPPIKRKTPVFLFGFGWAATTRWCFY